MRTSRSFAGLVSLALLLPYGVAVAQQVDVQKLASVPQVLPIEDLTDDYTALKISVGSNADVMSFWSNPRRKGL